MGEPRCLARVLLSATLAFSCAPATLAGVQADEEPLLAVRAARLIDGTGGPPIADAVVLIRADRIEAVGTDLDVPATAPTIDLGDATLLPGLIDLTRASSRSA